MLDLAGRTDFWNIGYPLLGAIVYLVAPISVAFIAYALYRRVQFWRVGAEYDELGSHSTRIREFLRAGAFGFGGHGKFHPHRERYATVMHFAIFWGFAVLLLATAVAAIEFNFEEYLGVTFPTAHFRLQTSFVWDVFGGVLAAIGIGMAYWRRYVVKPERLNTFGDDSLILAYLFLLLTTGFALEGLRIGATELNPNSDLYAPADALWSPVGWLVGKLVHRCGHLDRCHAFVAQGVVVDARGNLRHRFGVCRDQLQQVVAHHRLLAQHLFPTLATARARLNRWVISKP